jgi:2,3-bisphosphoglycerate-independent phosphoglycerate mutase
MATPKAIIFLGDGMADEPIPELADKTPLQHAHTPAMDSIARDGCSGTLLTLPEGFPTSSDVANMSVLGCDLATEFTGRGPLEAAGRGIMLGPDDIALRLNLTTQDGDILKDYSAGHIDQDDATALIEHLGGQFEHADICFYTGVSFRNLLVISGKAYSDQVATDKPDDNVGQPVSQHLPTVMDPEAEATAKILLDLIAAAPQILAPHPVNQRRISEGKPPANGVWPWSPGRAGALRTLQSRYGVHGAVISAVDVITGLGVCLGMDIIPVDGATGYIDTNYEGKADAAIAALDNHDFVFLHVEATDEVSHEQDLKKKLQAIEDFDRRVVGRVLDAIDHGVTAAVLPDHPVPLAMGVHTRTPVPVALRQSGMPADDVTTFDEIACKRGSLGAMQTDGLMRAIFEG